MSRDYQTQTLSLHRTAFFTSVGHTTSDSMSVKPIIATTSVSLSHRGRQQYSRPMSTSLLVARRCRMKRDEHTDSPTSIGQAIPVQWRLVSVMCEVMGTDICLE